MQQHLLWNCCGSPDLAIFGQKFSQAWVLLLLLLLYWGRWQLISHYVLQVPELTIAPLAWLHISAIQEVQPSHSTNHLLCVNK
jgi:hypothetical protein